MPRQTIVDANNTVFGHSGHDGYFHALYRHWRFDVRVASVVQYFEIFEFVIENTFGFAFNLRLKITDPVAMEKEINHWPGVVTNGLFAIRKADVVLIATADGIKTL